MMRWEDDGLDMLAWVAVAGLAVLLAAIAAVIGIAAWVLA